MNIIRNLLHTSQQNRPLNIITFVAHERYEPNLALTGDNYISLCFEGTRRWRQEYAAIPQNYHIVYSKEPPKYFNYDLIISHNPYVHIEPAYRIKQQLNIPIINIFHTMPTPGWNKDIFNQHRKLFDLCDHHVFISEFNRRAWGFENENNTTVIHHGIDTEFFRPNYEDKQPYILSVANDYINRDWALGFNLWKTVTNGLPTRPVGDTPGLSKPTKDINDLLNEYQKAQAFINTSLASPIPMSVLEAMSCGLGIVSTNTCLIPDIIEHKKNGLLCSPRKPEQFRQYLIDLLQNPDLCKQLGVEARKTIIDKFSISSFVNNWKTLIDHVLHNS